MKDFYKSYGKRSFEYFFGWFERSGFFYVIPDISELMFTVLISYQLFIYIQFDKKMKLGLDKLIKKKNENSKK